MNMTQLRQIGVPRKYKADDIIFHQGEPGEEMHVLLSGKVAVYINSINGFPIQVAVIEPGNIFGEMSILEDEPRSATVIASEESVTITFNRENFRLFIKKQPELTFKLLKVLSGRIRILNEQLAQKWGSIQEKPEKCIDDTEIKSEEGKHNQADTDTCSQKAYRSPATQELFPSGHKSYTKNIALDDKQFTFKKNIYCPVCDHQFDVKVQKISKMQLSSTDYDFRQRFIDFEPIYHSIWMCPSCNYANFHSNFQIISKKSINILKKTSNKRKAMANIHLMDPGDINYIFTQYYMADKCLDEICASDINKAKIWIRLKWLYQDLEDQEMYKFALSRGIELYFNSLYHARPRLGPEQEQQVSLILGELYMENNQNKDAQKHFWTASRVNGGKEVLRRQARDRLWDVKSINDEKSRPDNKKSNNSSNKEKIFLKA